MNPIRKFLLIAILVFVALAVAGVRDSSLAFFAPNSAAQRTENGSEITVIEGASLIDGVSSASIQDAVLIVKGDTIQKVGKRADVKIPKNARIIDASGKTIIPGIFNLHGHVAMVEGWVSKPENFNRSRLQRDANTYLYYGVTNMLSLGTDRAPMIAFQADQRAGKAGGARLYSAGLGFAAPNGFIPEGNKDINRPTTPEEARAMVQKEINKGVDVIKIWIDDGYGTLPTLSPEIYGAIIDEAHKHNRKVCAHMRTLDDAKELIRRGVDMLAHSVRDEEVDAEFLELAKEKGVTQDADLVGHNSDIAYAEGASFLNDPGLPGLFPPDVLKTLATKEFQRKIANGWGRGNGSGDLFNQHSDLEADNSALLERTRKEYEIAVKNVGKIAAAGIPIVVGTDSGRTGHFQGLWEHREMELLVEAGLTPMQAIQAGTIQGARFLRVDKKLGSLEPGKIGDFIVLDADPLANITNTRKIDSVWMNGKRVNREKLKSYPTGS